MKRVSLRRTSFWAAPFAIASIAACSPVEESSSLEIEGGAEAGPLQGQPGDGDANVGPAAPEAAPMEASFDRAAPTDWWNPMFARRRRLTFDARLASSDSGALVDFPVALRIPADTLDATVVAAGGADVRFVDATGTVLSREIEAWDPHGVSILWLKVATLPLAATAPIYMYYGASGTPPAPNDRQAVWPSPYAAVWHFAGKADDATANHFDGAVTKATFDVGKLGQAAKFDAAAQDHIGLAQGSAIIRGAEAVTESAWIKTGAIDKASYGVILGIGTADTTGHLSRTSMMVWGSDATYPYGGQVMHNVLYGEINPDEAPGGWEFAVSPVDTVRAGEWHYVTIVYDAKGRSATVYSDGVAVGGPLVIVGQNGGAAATGNWKAAAFPASLSNRVEIGAEEDVTHGYFDGLIDELRVETVGRSPQWIAAQAIAVGGDAVTLGSEERATP